MDIPTSHNNLRRHSGGGGGREDCWSESDTATLIEAWGDRYLQLNRGNLRQKDWMEVADAVNANREPSKPPRTDVQCKNRIDTLKKKYKLEKAKTGPSKWPFFNRIEYLIGSSSSNNIVTPFKKRASARSKVRLIPNSIRIPIPVINPNHKPNSKRSANAVVNYSGESSKPVSSGSNESSLGVGGGGGGGGLLTEGTAQKEMAMAILRFGEIYERIESVKQKQMMELEKQRMEFTKSLEFERMNMFVEYQFKLERMKMRSRHSSATAAKKS